MHPYTLWVAGSAAALLLAGCGEVERQEPPPSPTPAASAGGWLQNHAPPSAPTPTPGASAAPSNWFQERLQSSSGTLNRATPTPAPGGLGAPGKLGESKR